MVGRRRDQSPYTVEMRLQALTLASFALFATTANTQDTEQDAVTLTGTNTASVSSVEEAFPTSGVTYADDSTMVITATRSSYTSLASVVDALNSTTTANSTDVTETILTGGAQTSTTATTNGTLLSISTSTSSSARPTNTVPCNGHPAFCSRRYSNVTQVAAHNSPFVRAGNAASNQLLDVETQLNDGIRMLQFQTHRVNDTMYLCHTSCDILNVGTLEAYLTKVVNWMKQNPTDVVTIVMGNDDVVAPGNYTQPVVNSGLIDYVYIPPTRPMPLESWPTFGDMILTNQRAVVMLDYEANQEEIPWLLDEFSQLWQTPFSPTNRDFPCTDQRPPDRPRDIRLDRMYTANHNLNVKVALAGISLDLPASNVINETNAVSGYGSLGRMVKNCEEMWGGRPPTWLLVDFYNLGNFNGSVFQVAATANNVTYDRDSCCGTNQRNLSNVAGSIQPTLVSMMAVALAAAAMVLL